MTELGWISAIVSRETYDPAAVKLEEEEEKPFGLYCTVELTDADHRRLC